MLNELSELQAKRQISAWMQDDSDRMQALEDVKSVSEASGQALWLAAGFVRNLVWDSLYLTYDSPLNDIDVIFHDQHNPLPEQDKFIEAQLSKLSPQFPWSVKNQARMHLRNGDSEYLGLQDAISYWPELQTAVAVRLGGEGELEFISAFGLACLFNGRLEHNPVRDRSVFLQRVQSKGWLQQYPDLLLTCD